MRDIWREKDQPGLVCLTEGHLWLDWRGTDRLELRQKIDPVPEEPVKASWCIWCGTGVSGTDVDPDTPVITQREER